MRQDIQELIQANKICVLATVSGAEPHCSLMSYAVDENCREIYMATHKQTKKYRNLTANPYVSLLVDSRQESASGPSTPTKALTISGTVQSDIDENKTADIRKRLFEKHADLKKIFNDPDTEMIVIKISAVQLLDGITDAYFEIIS
ncbi:MAG: pyridoxamine 5'-phosphate oxidase family protein [Deltaproteobacteria bacterium]